ncbi:MAG TPA: hypothetical protein PLV45_06470 [bacterium]|nr:hypothetical protein [bacterium]
MTPEKHPIDPFQLIVLPADPGIDSMIMDRLNAAVDGVVIPDNSGAAPGLDALVRAGDWIRHGYKTSVFMNCRDRNRIDLAARFRGAAYLGVRRIIIEAGRHTRLGTIPEALSVYDLDPLQSIRFLNMLRDRQTGSDVPAIGLRTTIQDIDPFEQERIQRICYVKPDFLVLSTGKPDGHIQRWLAMSIDIPGFSAMEMIWAAGMPGELAGEQLAIPDGMHGIMLSF